ncbi:MAG: Phosphate transport regulator [Humibacillus sp.]|nr:Phosphate transport regulator [Humibacillus sp.]
MGFRLTPQDTSFFTLFTAQAQLLVDATRELTRFLEVDQSQRQAVADRLKDLEHAADEATHELINKVNSSFITPFDREDIHNLTAALDDVMDLIEETGDLIVLYRVGEIPDGLSEQFEILSRMAEVTAEAMPRLRSLKDLKSYWIEINRLENQADSLHRKQVAALFNNSPDPVNLIRVKAIVDGFEDAADAFEKVAHLVEGIAVKES